jgi:hypothetical protein
MYYYWLWAQEDVVVREAVLGGEVAEDKELLEKRKD